MAREISSSSLLLSSVLTVSQSVFADVSNVIVVVAVAVVIVADVSSVMVVVIAVIVFGVWLVGVGTMSAGAIFANSLNSLKSEFLSAKIDREEKKGWTGKKA